MDKNKQPMKDSKGQPIIIKDPRDPRLTFRNDSHVMLALKMLRRGDEVPPNTRLQYVFLDTGNSKELQGLKAEEYGYFKENRIRKKLKLDPLYYLEKQLAKPITEIINVLYRTKKIKYETLDDKIKRFENHIFEKMDSSIKDNIIDMRQFILTKFKTIIKEGKNISEYKSRVKMVTTQIRTLKDDKILNIFNNLVKLYYTKKSENVLEIIEKAYGLKKKGAKKHDKKTGLIVVDGQVMENIIKYRTTYQESVRHLQNLFSIKFN